MHTPDSMDDPGLSSSPNSEGVQSPPATPTHSADNEKEIPDKNDFAAIRARRRAQNRLSQRAFRERRERHVKNLEHQFHDLLIKHQMLLKSYWMQKTELAQLRRTVDQLTGQVKLVQTASSSKESIRRSKPINTPNSGNETCMDATIPITAPAAAATTTPCSLSPSSSSVSSHGFDEMNMGFKQSSSNDSNNIDANANMNMPFFPLDGQLQPQQQPLPQQSPPQQLPPRFNSEDINVNVLTTSDDAYTYMNSLADWSQRLDLGLSLDAGKGGPNLMTMPGSVSGLGSSNINMNDSNGDVCFGWNYLDL